MKSHTVTLKVNGEPHTLLIPPYETLLDTLRDRLHLTGAKRGCEMGDCGSCTVLLNDEPVNACLVLTVECDGAFIQTVEGITHPIQERFIQHNAFQCGFCAPGFVVSSKHLLEKNPHPKKEDALQALSGHLCRCTGYQRILQALLHEQEEGAPEEPLTVVGRSVPRKDIRAKVEGKAKFTADLYFPGMVYGALVTSPHPHAKVKSLDPSDALKMDGVLLFLGPEDVPQTPYGVSPARYDETILTRHVRHVGDAVGAIFAKDRWTAQRAAQLVKVEYEVLPGVFDVDEAQKEEAPQIHERYPKNVNTEIHHQFGDKEKLFQEADYVREDHFETSRTHQGYLEPPASLAMEQDGVIHVWTASQAPYYTWYHLCRVLEIPEEKLRVIKPAMGGGFGGKAEVTKLDFLAVIASQKLKRPVLMAMDRRQAFLHGRGRHGQKITLKSAFKKDGTLLGSHITTVLDGGAYTGYGIITAYYSGCLITTPYKLPEFFFDGYRIATNLPPCGAQRGNGTPHPRFAFESHLDLAARDLGLDPYEIRMKNLMEPGHITVNAFEITSCGIKECLETLDKISHFREKWGKLPYGKGIGIALGCFISGAGYPIIRGDGPHSSAMVRVSDGGDAVYLYTGAPDIGQGSDTILCQMVAEVLGIPYEKVNIYSSDTAITPKDLGAYASRITYMAGNAVVQAAQEVRKKLEGLWKEKVDSLTPEFHRGRVATKENSLSFQELARMYIRERGPLVGEGVYNPPRLGGSFKGAAVGTSPAYSFCAMASEVAVDPETGFMKVERIYAVHDSGRVINPALFHGQVAGAIVMGLGETLLEKVEFIQGIPRNPNFHDYLMPTPGDAPEIISSTIHIKDPKGPFGAKEVGEGSILPVMGSIANAIEDAVGVRIKSLPITPEKVYRAIIERKNAIKGR